MLVYSIEPRLRTRALSPRGSYRVYIVHRKSFDDADGRRFRAAYGSLPRRRAIRRMADHQQLPPLGGLDGFWSRRQRPGECIVRSCRKRRPRDGASLRRFCFWALVIIAVVLGAVFLATFQFIPWRAVFRVSQRVSARELEVTCGLVLALFVINLPLNLLRSLYNAHQDGYLANIWGIAYAVLSLLGLIIVTRFHGGLPQLVVAISGVPALSLLANAYYAFVRRYPWLAPAPSAVRWNCIRRLLKLGGQYMVLQLASLGIYQSQAMIITQTLGPSQVVIFVVTYKVVTLPMDLVYMGTVPFIAAVAEAKARRDWKWIKGAYKNATATSVALGVPLAAALAIASKPLILLWAGPSAVPDTHLVLWLFIYAAFGVSLMMSGQLLCGVERLEALTVSIVLCSIGCIVLGVLFAPRWGLAGVAFAMAISKVISFSPIQMYEVRRLFRAALPVQPQRSTE